MEVLGFVIVFCNFSLYAKKKEYAPKILVGQNDAKLLETYLF